MLMGMHNTLFTTIGLVTVNYQMNPINHEYGKLEVKWWFDDSIHWSHPKTCGCLHWQTERICSLLKSTWANKKTSFFDYGFGDIVFRLWFRCIPQLVPGWKIHRPIWCQNCLYEVHRLKPRRWLLQLCKIYYSNSTQIGSKPHRRLDQAGQRNWHCEISLSWR